MLVVSSGHSRWGNIQQPDQAVNCCRFTSFVLSFLRWHHRGELTDWEPTPAEVPFIRQVRIICYIDKGPQSCVKAAGKRGGIVVCFPAAFISINIKTVEQNARNDNQKPNKVKWADKFPQTQCVHYAEVWSCLWLGHIFLSVTDNWMGCEVMVPLLLKLGLYRITN